MKFIGMVLISEVHQSERIAAGCSTDLLRNARANAGIAAPRRCNGATGARNIRRARLSATQSRI
jgi:hypothetical protein